LNDLTLAWFISLSYSYLCVSRFTQIPEEVYELPLLEILFANDNRIASFDALKIVKMPTLTHLNLQNNDIMQVPNELGKAEQLRSLQLEGNPFRLPRSQTLAKGTNAILEYLQNRLADG
jgi:Leucine-rich repeat (LRR) protein